MRTALVLGAGGTVGLAYHVGALRALEHQGVIVPSEADLIVGTSAGAAIGAYLRAGWTTEALWDVALSDDAAADDGAEGVFTPSFTTPLALVRRTLGTAYVLARSAVRFPSPRIPRTLQRAFPAGLFVLSAGRERLAAELPEAWPAEPLWLCTVDLTSGRRVVLGDGPLPDSLHDAVLASCAIPGVYPPVRIGPHTLVDGGVHSSTNLDLIIGRDGSDRPRAFDRVVCVAPMAFDTSEPPPAAFQLIRRLPARQLSAEAALARDAGIEVLLVRPSAADIRLHGANFMRLNGWDRIAAAAYESTCRLVESRRFDQGLGNSAATTL